MKARTKPTKRGKERAPAGAGRATITGRAKVMATHLGHEMGQFRQHHNTPRITYHARCKRCIALAIVIPENIGDIHGGVGGSAVTRSCPWYGAEEVNANG